MLCGELTLTTLSDDRVVSKAWRCKTWRCPHCRPMLTRKVIARALDGRPTTLLTLTTSPTVEPDPHRAAEMLYRAWRRLIRTLRKQYPEHNIQYMVIWEATKRGHPHIHVLLRAPYIPQKMISDFMNREIGAPVVDIRRIRSKKHVANYVAKYLAKAPYAFVGRQRFHTSRRWRLTPDPWKTDPSRRMPGQWHLVLTQLPYWAEVLSRDGYKVRWIRDDTLIATRAGP